MPVTITANFDKDTLTDAFRVSVDVVAATGISLDVLVFDVEDDSFSRVASAYDMEVYPVGSEAAEAAGAAYYRGRSVTRDFSDLLTATEFELVTKGRLKFLAVAWNTSTSSFVGESLVTFDSDTDS